MAKLAFPRERFKDGQSDIQVHQMLVLGLNEATVSHEPAPAWHYICLVFIACMARRPGSLIWKYFEIGSVRMCTQSEVLLFRRVRKFFAAARV